MKKLRLILSSIDGINFTIIADEFGEERSKLPFSDSRGDSRLFTVLRSLDKIGTGYKINEKDDRDWMIAENFLSPENNQFFHPDMAKNIGRKLYESLFIGKIEKALLTALAEAKGERLHISIQYDANVIESSYLSLYPWQLAHDGAEFLADRQVSFSYLIAHPNLLPQGKRTVEQIKVLLIPSAASNEQYQPIESKKAVIGQGLQKAIQGGRIRLLSWYNKETETPTRERLRAYLTEQDEQPDIIHFDGHGFFKKKCPKLECSESDVAKIFHSLSDFQCKVCKSPLEKAQGFLCFESDSSEIDYMSGDDFARLVGQSKPALVIITACKSALAYKSDSVFNGVAQKLLRYVPAVIATPFSISEKSATDFVEQFYRALGAKKSLLEAVKLASDAMHYHKYEWYRLILFLRADRDEEGNLFEFDAIEPPEYDRHDPKIKKLQEDIEQLEQEYEGMSQDARNALTSVMRGRLGKQADILYDELSLKKEELHNLLH
ncbi:CHAT domain-containing protein [Spirulina sp. 06S082]|uniref:CHAT domain-containing protein n=1 Tax=Spirulina sp. 06S082 TaxID=3110248 RepID=UPI002B1F8959|nr:CHAT domain-containing protein [Spirulina sp. 06S082]MEA5467649.1 CHAT domain-containing protein [Spirulina sp. 06S082]